MPIVWHRPFYAVIYEYVVRAGRHFVCLTCRLDGAVIPRIYLCLFLDKTRLLSGILLSLSLWFHFISPLQLGSLAPNSLQRISYYLPAPGNYQIEPPLGLGTIRILCYLVPLSVISGRCPCILIFTVLLPPQMEPRNAERRWPLLHTLRVGM